jgi:hypothetical protein
MEVKAKLTGVSRGLYGGYNLTFTTEEDIRQNLEVLQDKILRLHASEWREKRSISANGYYYALLSKIAQKAKITLVCAHNRTIADYGQIDFEKDEDGEDIKTKPTCVLLLDSIDYLEIPWAHLHPTTETRMVGGVVYRKYLVMRGSHTYDTTEMSALISGTIEDAKALGIETLTPAQLEDMYRSYEINHRKKRD